MKHTNKIAIIIPAHNEGKVIGKTILSLLDVVGEKHIYVVNDGSTDYTDKIARSLVQNVLTLPTSQRKAGAINTAIAYFDLVNNYDFIMPIDADTLITKSFIATVLPIFEKDSKNEIACIVGKVTGKKKNWITAYRMWEYEIAQTIHKSAQSIENAVMICTGCATVYRSDIFQSIAIPNMTLTEDMDLTFLIHRQKLGKIVYAGNARVITQDPASLQDYLRQLTRWYTGFWQCLIKHNIPWGGQSIDFEVGLIALEGLFNGLLVAFSALIIPFVLHVNPLIIAIPICVDLFLFLIPTVLYTGVKNKIHNVLLFLPHFYLLRFLSSLIFLYCFLKIIMAWDIQMNWYKVVRY